ncbi:MAG: N-acetylmuramoyl-L-alanine amidase, partial [bacterium]
ADSSFIFGNVTPGAQLTINGFDIPVHLAGGWLAFLPLQPGEFEFKVVAVLESDTNSISLQVRVPEPYRVPPRDSLVIVKSYRVPARNSGLMVGDWAEFSFRGTPDYHGYVELSTDSVLTQLTEGSPQPQSYWGRALFGEADIPDSLLVRGVYGGTLKLAQRQVADSTQITFHLCRYPLNTLDRSGVDFEYDYQSCGCISSPNPVQFKVSDDDVFIVGELIDSVQIIRTGPRKGYLSIFQPRGLKFRITGYYQNYLRAELAPNQHAWLPDSSIKLLPPGALLPKGEVVLVRTFAEDDQTRISFDVGAQVPFRVEEDVVAGRLQLDLYNCTSNIDWIRYDRADELVELIRWSQPEDGILRLTVDLNEPLWGYDCNYEGTQFNLILKHPPKLFRDLRNLRIVVDPGHSPDPGAIGPTGYEEKDANLAIALKLADILRERHAQVMLTREDNSSLGLHERPVLADRYDADIFISVHNNALPDGVNPFFNNGSSTYYYHPHSKALAESVQEQLVADLGLGDYGLYHANFAVSRPTGYLAILVESAFMMIPAQEQLLRDPDFQEKVARAIADGLVNYLRAERALQQD